MQSTIHSHFYRYNGHSFMSVIIGYVVTSAECHAKGGNNQVKNVHPLSSTVQILLGAQHVIKLTTLK